MTMQALVIEVDEYTLRRDYHAVMDFMHDGLAYFIKDGKIVGVGRHTSNNGLTYTFEPHDDAAKAFFANDFADPAFRWFKFYRTGEYAGTFTDEPEDRGKGLSIVSKTSLDYGLVSKERYGHIPGYGDATKPKKLTAEMTAKFNSKVCKPRKSKRIKARNHV